MSLNRTIPIPLYYQLAEILSDRIRRGELHAGQQLPAERELSDQYGISRMTVRQALAHLIQEGTLVARQGLGTFVAEPKLTTDPAHLLSFTEEMMGKGTAVSSRVLDQAILPPPVSVVEGLELKPGSLVIKIMRLRQSAEIPLLLETVYVPADLCPGLEEIDLSRQSLYALFEGRFGLRPQRTRQTLESALANGEEAELFGIAAGTAMILLRGVTYLDTGLPVEYYKALYRGDRFKFAFESERTAWKMDAVDVPRMSVILR